MDDRPEITPIEPPPEPVVPEWVPPPGNTVELPDPPDAPVEDGPPEEEPPSGSSHN